MIYHADFMDEEEEEDLAERLSVEMLPLHGRDRWHNPVSIQSTNVYLNKNPFRTIHQERVVASFVLTVGF